MFSGESLATCDREEQFREMLAVLGNREAQDGIREQSPHARHCKLLISKSPSFCSNCPNNPVRKPDALTPSHVAKRHEAIETAERTSNILECSLLLLERCDMGERMNYSRMRPADLAMLRIARLARRSFENISQARLIAIELASVLRSPQ